MFARNVSRSNFTSQRHRQFGSRMLFSAHAFVRNTHPSLLCGIPHVVGVRASKKMLEIDATRIVATMANAWWGISICSLKHDTMSKHAPPIEPNHAIASTVFCSRPNMTTTVGHYKPLKRNLNWQFCRHVLTVSVVSNLLNQHQAAAQSPAARRD